MKRKLLSYKYLKEGSAWLFLILGIALYYLGYFEVKNDSVWKEIIIKIADVLVIGVILGYLSNAAQFLGVFKQDLQDIIYGKEFLKQRKDIHPLWEAVSKQVFKNKFPVIHKEFLQVISGYFPDDEISFYSDYESRIIVEWYDQGRRMIKTTEIVAFELIADSPDEFQYPLGTYSRIIDKHKYSNKITRLCVNGKNESIGKEVNVNDNEDICSTIKVPLSGSTKYDIKYTREKVYCIDDDYYIGFRSKYIVNKLRVSIELPPDIDAIFICRGTSKDFEDVNSTKNKIEKKYKGIILPRQGYIFALNYK